MAIESAGIDNKNMIVQSSSEDTKQSEFASLLNSPLVAPYIFGLLSCFYTTCEESTLSSPDDFLFGYRSGDGTNNLLLGHLLYPDWQAIRLVMDNVGPRDCQLGRIFFT